MEESKDFYENMTKEDIENTLYKVVEKSLEGLEDRRFIYCTGKLGAIQSLLSLEKACGKSDEDLEISRKQLEDTLKEGTYKFDSKGLDFYTYLGQ